MKRIVFLTIASMLLQSAWSQGAKEIDWHADLEYLLRELPAKHYNLFAVRSQADFMAGIGAIEAESANLTDFEIALKTQRLLASLGDSHTWLNFYTLQDKEQILPLGLLFASDGLYVVNTTRGNETLLGRRIDAFNGFPTATVIDSLATIHTADNPAVVKNVVPTLLPSLQILRHFGFADTGSVELSLDRGDTYRLHATRIEKKDQVAFEPDSMAFGLKNRELYFTDHYFADEKIYYLLYNECWSRELEMQVEYGDPEKAKTMPSFNEFAHRIFRTLDSEAVDKIIFDMRYNGGGSSLQGTELIKKLALFLKKHPEIRIYVVIGRDTFSSAVLNTMDFKEQTNALLVGEPTSGKPNHFGEVRGFRLPGSQLRVNYSTKYFKRSEQDVDTITPDVLLEMSFSDYARGIDPVYEWIRAQ